MQRKPLTKFNSKFMVKTLQKVGMEGTYHNIIKVIYYKHTANIILNGKKLKALPLKAGTKQGCPLALLLFNSFGSPSHSYQRRKIKGIHFGKELTLTA